MRKKHIAVLLVLFALIFGGHASRAQTAQTEASKFVTANLLGKTIEECEQLLGSAKYVEGFGTSSSPKRMSQTRYYKVVNFKRITLLRRVESTNGRIDPLKDRRLVPEVAEVVYAIPKVKVKTWQESLKLVGLNPDDFKYEKGVGDCVYLNSVDNKYAASWFPAGWTSGKGGKPDAANHTLSISLKGIPRAVAQSAGLDLKAFWGKDEQSVVTILGNPKTREFRKYRQATGDGNDYDGIALEFGSVKGFTRVSLFLSASPGQVPKVKSFIGGLPSNTDSKDALCLVKLEARLADKSRVRSGGDVWGKWLPLVEFESKEVTAQLPSPYGTTAYVVEATEVNLGNAQGVAKGDRMLKVYAD